MAGAAASATAVTPGAGDLLSRGTPQSAEPPRAWYGDSPELEARVPQLIQAQRAAEARLLLQTRADNDSAITQFYLGVVTGVLGGEAVACASPGPDPDSDPDPDPDSDPDPDPDSDPDPDPHPDPNVNQACSKARRRRARTTSARSS